MQNSKKAVISTNTRKVLRKFNKILKLSGEPKKYVGTAKTGVAFLKVHEF
jgi:hypothetical protein